MGLVGNKEMLFGNLSTRAQDRDPGFRPQWLMVLYTSHIPHGNTQNGGKWKPAVTGNQTQGP